MPRRVRRFTEFGRASAGSDLCKASPPFPAGPGSDPDRKRQVGLENRLATAHFATAQIHHGPPIAPRNSVQAPLASAPNSKSRYRLDCLASFADPRVLLQVLQLDKLRLRKNRVFFTREMAETDVLACDQVAVDHVSKLRNDCGMLRSDIR